MNIEKTPKRYGQDPQEDNKVVGNEHFGPTGANNDSPTPKSGDTLEDLTMGAKESSTFSGVSEGQQSPRDGKPDLK